jgi:hypothetical protein
MLFADTQSRGWCVRCSALHTVRLTHRTDNRNQQFVRRTTHRSSARDGPECRGGAGFAFWPRRAGRACWSSRPLRVGFATSPAGPIGPCEPGSSCGLAALPVLVGPGGPASPRSPAPPCGPTGTWGPSDPCGPAGPAGPGGPAGRRARDGLADPARACCSPRDSSQLESRKHSGHAALWVFQISCWLP